MKKELTPSEIIFSASNYDVSKETSAQRIPKTKTTLNKIKRALGIRKSGYNIYYVDTFSKEKLDDLIEYLETIYEKGEKPDDICYVTGIEDGEPVPLILKNGKGSILKSMLEAIKEKYYDCVTEFYAVSSDEEKEDIIKDITEKRNSYITALMNMAKDKNFDIKATTNGFVFIPLKDEGEQMTNEEYDKLENLTQESIEKQADDLKKEAELVLEKLKDIELTSIDKLKKIYRDYLDKNMQKDKDDLLLEFIAEDDAYKYLVNLFNYFENEIINSYTINLEEDEEYIQEAFDKCVVNVLVDNSKYSHPRIIYEEDPTVSNLIGNIEYKNNNGSYSTDISLINPGSILKANGGCLILRLNSLVSSGSSYYYLKKALIHGRVDYNYTRSYLEVLSIAGLKPGSIPVNVKIILIGDYESYDILYDRDEDFKRIFPIKIEADSEVRYNYMSRKSLKSIINKKIKDDELLEITDDGFDEIIKYLARICGERDKISVDDYSINRLLYQADNNAKIKEKEKIDKDDIIEVAYEEEKILENIMDNYKKKKILISITGEKIGAVNGLAVVGTGYYAFGKPMRLTCLAVCGDGNIVDIHKESKMSGSIHEKSIGILRGLLSNSISPYEKLPVDLHVSFEQTYGMIEGDSASVAEIICMLSALSKRPIRQNIAVTGSLNQFGEVQPIGGVNEKIEGFYRVCQTIDNIDNKGVLIPSTNADELILNYNVEKSVKEKKFHIYIMENLEDAIEVLILKDGENIKNFYKDIENEIYKYKSGKKKK